MDAPNAGIPRLSAQRNAAKHAAQRAELENLCGTS
jgi:hypothetical protein